MVPNGILNVAMLLCCIENKDPKHVQYSGIPLPPHPQVAECIDWNSQIRDSSVSFLLVSFDKDSFTATGLNIMLCYLLP